MKRGILLLTAFAVCMAALADERSAAILSKMERTVSSLAAYEARFAASLDDEFYDVEGVFVVSGKKYFLEVYGSQIFFDGSVRSAFTRADNEVVLESPDPADKSILSDPTAIFRFTDGDFTHSSVDDTTVKLTPARPNGIFESAVLKVDGRSFLPVSIEYTLSGGKKMEILITKISPVDPSAETFTFDAAKYPGAEVIDFR